MTAPGADPYPETLGTNRPVHDTGKRAVKGTKALYPTFVNLGAKEALEGTNDLFILKLKAKRAVKFDLKAIDGVLVDKNLNTRKF